MALSQVELFLKFSSFPDESQVRDICKIGQGDKACRYLERRVTANRNGYQCEKAGAYRKIIDSDVQEDAIIERGDNCRGVLGFVDENQNDLHGLSMLSQVKREGDKTRRTIEPFDTLIVDEGYVTVGSILEVPEEDVELVVDSQGITFIKLDDPDGGELTYRKETILFENPLK